MGFTIEDMLLISRQRYQMELAAGNQGWSNSISWLLMLEDVTIIHNFSGKELAVTTGLGFRTEESLLELLRLLNQKNAAGLIINTGYYIHEIPEECLRYCNENSFPLLTVPWDVYLADMIKDLSIRVFLQSSTDEQISAALIRAIEHPGEKEQYLNDLLPHFDTDGTFQVSLITTDGLDKMDTVERRRIAYRMQLYFANLTHNGHFLYYDSCFVVIMNAIEESQARQIIDAFQQRLAARMPEASVWIGVSGQVMDISRLRTAYLRARAALSMEKDQGKKLQYFDEMGVYRVLYSVPDKELLNRLCSDALGPLLDYDREHGSNYVETLEMYLKTNGSIQAMSAAMYIHRNTIIYRMNNIRQLTGCSMETTEERLPYIIACMILRMGEG